MENNNLLKNSFYSYPKSLNHKIVWKKNDNIKTCDLGSNCTELEFNITQNKLVKHKTFNNNLDNMNNMENINNINNIDNIDNIENFTSINCMSMNSKIITNLINYDIVLFFLILVLIFVLVINSKSRK